MNEYVNNVYLYKYNKYRINIYVELVVNNLFTNSY